MRFVLLGIFVFCFLVIPMYLLNTVMMPELAGLQQTYAHADDIAARVAEPQSR